MSSRRLLLLAPVVGLALAAPAAADPILPGTTALLSRPASGTLPAGGVNLSSTSRHHTISADGRFVVFSSDADGLLPAGTTSPYSQVFRLDRQTGAVRLVSHVAGGTAPGSGVSSDASISATGARVVFTTQAPDLVADDTNQLADAALWDAGTDHTALVSRASDNASGLGAQANQAAQDAVISSDGDHVAFASSATNLDPNDLTASSSIFVRDLNTTPASTHVVSLTNNGESPLGDAGDPALSADGSIVAFTSSTDDLGDPTVVDANGATDVFVRNRMGAQTRLVSRADDGAVSALGGTQPSIDDTGHTIAFVSRSSNLVTAIDVNQSADVFKRVNPFGGSAGTTTLMSRVPGVKPATGAGTSDAPSIAADGGSVAFASTVANLVPGDVNGVTDEFVRTASATAVVTRAADGTPAGGGRFDVAGAISPDGSEVAFQSSAALSELVDREFNAIYTAPVTGGAPVPISRPSGLSGPFRGGVADAQLSNQPLSADGRVAVFTSRADGLSTEDDDRFSNGFARDLRTGALALVTRASGEHGAPANANSYDLAVSADGTHVSFTTEARLDPADTDDYADAYVRDLRTNTTTLVSAAAPPDVAAGDGGGATHISADGSRVEFTAAYATPKNGVILGLYVRDVTAGTSTLVSRADGADGAPVDGLLFGGSMDRAGNRVVFSSASSVLGVAGPAQVFVRDLAAHTTTLVSRADGPDGAAAVGGGDGELISGDGRTVAFDSVAGNLGAQATSGYQVYLRALDSGRTAAVTSQPDGQPVAVSSFVTGISDDGARVAISRSGSPVVVRDVKTDATQVLSRADGAAGALVVAAAGALSGDGHCGLFVAGGTGIVPDGYATGDFGQPYARGIDGGCGVDTPAGGGDPGTGGGGGTGGGPAGAGASPDRTAPVLDRLTATHAAFAVGKGATAVAARTPVRGTTLSYRLSESAAVVLTIERETAGLRSGKRCVKPTAKLRRRRAKACVRLVRAGSLRRASKAGTTRLAFSGRIGRKALANGRIRVSAVATDAAGNRSAPRMLRLKITPSR